MTHPALHPKLQRRLPWHGSTPIHRGGPHDSSSDRPGPPFNPGRSPAAFVGRTAQAGIDIGVILTLTGAGAALGIPEERALKLRLQSMADRRMKFTVLDDATDTGTATSNARKLINEVQVDAIIGASLTPTSLAVVEAAG